MFSNVFTYVFVTSSMKRTIVYWQVREETFISLSLLCFLSYTFILKVSIDLSVRSIKSSFVWYFIPMDKDCLVVFALYVQKKPCRGVFFFFVSLKIFQKFTGIHLYQSPLFSKIPGSKPVPLFKWDPLLSSFEFCEIFRKTYFEGHLRTAFFCLRTPLLLQRRIKYSRIVGRNKQKITDCGHGTYYFTQTAIIRGKR